MSKQRFHELSLVISTLHQHFVEEEMPPIGILIREPLETFFRGFINSSHAVQFVLEQCPRYNNLHSVTSGCFIDETPQFSQSGNRRRRKDCVFCSDRIGKNRASVTTFCTDCGVFLCGKCFGCFHEELRFKITKRPAVSYDSELKSQTGPGIVVPSKIKIGFLGCSSPAGNGLGDRFDKIVFHKLSNEFKQYEFDYVSSDLWTKWNPEEYFDKLKQFAVVVLWASLQDVCGDVSLTSSAHTEWADVFYKSHPKIVPSKKVLLWETSKSYLKDLVQFALPGTEFLGPTTSNLNISESQKVYLKSPLACAGRLHHTADSNNKKKLRDTFS